MNVCHDDHGFLTKISRLTDWGEYNQQNWMQQQQQQQQWSQQPAQPSNNYTTQQAHQVPDWSNWQQQTQPPPPTSQQPQQVPILINCYASTIILKLDYNSTYLARCNARWLAKLGSTRPSIRQCRRSIRTQMNEYENQSNISKQLRLYTKRAHFRFLLVAELSSFFKNPPICVAVWYFECQTRRKCFLHFKL